MDSFDMSKALVYGLVLQLYLPYVFFASGNNDDMGEYPSSSQIVLTRSVENSDNDESSLAETLHPPKNPNDVVSRQKDRPGPNERVMNSSVINENAYNEVVSGNILTAESFRRCYSVKRKTNVCMNTPTTNTTRVPLGVNGRRTASGEEQHPKQRRLRAVQLCDGGGKNVDNFATKTVNQCGASQVSGKKVLTVIDRMATTNDTEKHLSEQTNSVGDRKCLNKPLLPPLGADSGETKQRCCTKKATTFYNHWTEEFGKHLRTKRKIHVGVPEVGAKVLVIDTLLPPRCWYLTEVTGIKHRKNVQKDVHVQGKVNNVPRTRVKTAFLAKNNLKPPWKC